MSTGICRVDFIKDHKDLCGLRAQWETLYDESDASPYLSYEWVSSALRHFGPEGELFLSFVSDEGGLRAIVPLEMVRERLGVLPVNVVRFALEGWALRNGSIMAARAKGEEIRTVLEVLEFMANRGVRWDYCRLCLIPGSAKTPLPSGKEISKGRIVRSIDYVNMGSSTVIEPPAKWEDYLRGLSRNRRERIKRSAKQMEKKGPLRMVRLGLNASPSNADLDQLMQDALSVCRRSWQGSATVGWAISDPEVADFFCEVNRASAEKGMVDLSVLYAGDTPVSFCWGMFRRPHSSINKLGYDPSFSDCSPGYVHLPRLIADSVERGIKEIDFGHEFPEYKKNWGTRQDDIYNALIYPRGALPHMIQILRTIKRRYWRN